MPPGSPLPLAPSPKLFIVQKREQNSFTLSKEEDNAQFWLGATLCCVLTVHRESNEHGIICIRPWAHGVSRRFVRRVIKLFSDRAAVLLAVVRSSFQINCGQGIL